MEKMENQRRKEWLESMLRIVSPVFDALEKEELHKTMPLDFHEERSEYAPLEAFGRSMLGIAPWLEAEGLEEEEEKLQAVWRKKALRCLDAATDPESADFMNFTTGGQPLVDTAFLCHALVRAPKQLAGSLTERVRHNLAQALRSSRTIMAGSTNWLFFSAMVEAGLYLLGEKDYDKMRIAYALRSFEGWYKGDGVYGDGEMFHWDYYNSFVIQPMYVDLLELFGDSAEEYRILKEKVTARASRYASVLERMIAPDGSYPVIGRSICYRFGAFQMLAQAALQHRLEKGLTPAGVRCALTAVLRRCLENRDMFDENGWLRPGVYGFQPELAEGYINVGSLYLCSAVFLPLGLPAADPFWTGEDEDWSGRKVWSGGHIAIDHALD
ncbi:hypothetical protein BLA28_26165 [Eisenbergiella tayi]|nr:hypothetical protein BLA28_26165 [Eisenbergiella tayi]